MNYIDGLKKPIYGSTFQAPFVTTSTNIQKKTPPQNTTSSLSGRYVTNISSSTGIYPSPEGNEINLLLYIFLGFIGIATISFIVCMIKKKNHYEEDSISDQFQTVYP